MAYKQKHNKYADKADFKEILDFHTLGILNRTEIIKFTDNFIRDLEEKHLKKALIITGKGLHSSKGAIIAPLLKDYLKRHPSVKQLNTARRDRGGDGALEITLN